MPTKTKEKITGMKIIELSLKPRIDENWGFARPNFQPNGKHCPNDSDYTSTLNDITVA
jgi:hypothetical protein